MSVQLYQHVFSCYSALTISSRFTFLGDWVLKIQLPHAPFFTILAFRTMQNPLSRFRAEVFTLHSYRIPSLKLSYWNHPIQLLYSDFINLRESLVNPIILLSPVKTFRLHRDHTAMVEPLSLITGMMTLIGGVIGVVKYVRTFHRNAEELSELQVCIEVLQSLLLAHFTSSVHR